MLIHDRVKIHSNCYIAQFTELGTSVPRTRRDDRERPVSRDTRSRRADAGTVSAGRQIGVNVTLLPYVRIGRGAIVGAGSVVTRDIPDRMIAFGSPAVPVRARPDGDDDLKEIVMRRASHRSAAEPAAVTTGNYLEAR